MEIKNLLHDKQHLLFIILLFILIAIVFFKMAFLNYVPEHNLNNEIEKLGNCLNDSTFPSNKNLWNNEILSGIPRFPSSISIEHRIVNKIILLVNKLINWKVLFLFLAGLGIYVFLSFLRIESIISFTCALILPFSFYILGLLKVGYNSEFRAICFVPWVLFSIHYLKERRSILALGLLTLSLSLLLKEVEFQIIYATIFFMGIYWFIFLVLEISNNNIKKFLIFSLLLLAAIFISILSSVYPYFYLFELKKLAICDFIKIDVLKILYIYLHFFIIFILGFGLTFVIIKSKYENRTFFNLILTMIIVLFIVFIATLSYSVISTKIEPNQLLIQSFLTMIFILGLTLFLGYKKINKSLYLVFTCLIILINLIISNTAFIKELIPLKNRVPYTVKTLADEFLVKDESTFRIYPLGKEFTKNHWAMYNQTIGGKSNINLRRYREIIEYCLDAELQNRVPINWNIVNMLNSKYLIYNKKLPFANLEYAFYDLKQKLTIYKNNQTLPRLWFVENIEFLKDKKKIFKRLNQAEFNPAVTAIVESKIDSIKAPEDGKINIKEYNPQSIICEIETDTKSFLTISEIYCPLSSGWKAYLDKEDAVIYPTNYILRGIVIPPGKHLLEMKYKPEYLKLFIKLNLLGIVIIIIFIILGIIHYFLTNYRGEIVYIIKK